MTLSESMFLTADATQLAHALAAMLAAESGARVLTIKGPASDLHRLREPRVAADADVLVDPVAFISFCTQLEARGWRTRYGRETPSVLPPHSQTYIHPHWPCDIDVHSSFPGFFGEPAAAFEALWATRVQIMIAHTPIFAPSRAGSAVIAALHAQRSSQSARHRAEGSQILSVVGTEFREDEKSEFYRIARAGGAVWVLRDLIGSLRLGAVVADARPAEQRLWELNRSYNEDGSAVGWLLHWKAAKWSQRFSILARAVWVPRADIPRNDASVLPTRAEARHYRRARWRRGVAALRRYLSKSRVRS